MNGVLDSMTVIEFDLHKKYRPNNAFQQPDVVLGAKADPVTNRMKLMKLNAIHVPISCEVYMIKTI